MEDEMFQAFKIANTGWYLGKPIFYKLKEKLLQLYGDYVGYDVQFIKKKCDTCGGTGNFLYWKKNCYGFTDGYDRCNDCGGSGVYEVKKYYLKRFVLNDEIFHIPTYQAPKFGDRINATIKGKIKHDVYTPDECYKALLKLAAYYDKEIYQELIKENPRAKFINENVLLHGSILQAVER